MSHSQPCLAYRAGTFEDATYSSLPSYEIQVSRGRAGKGNSRKGCNAAPPYFQNQSLVLFKNAKLGPYPCKGI